MNDLAPDVVLNGLRDGGLVSYGTQSSSDRVCNATLHDQLYQAEIVERRDFPRLVSLDVRVDQVSHIGFVRLEVERFAAGVANDLPHVEVVCELILDAAHIGWAVSRALQLVGNVGVGADQGSGGFVERGALGLPLLEVRWNLGVAAEVVDVLELASRSCYRLANQRQRFDRGIETLPPLLQAILNQHFGVRPTGA